MTADHQIRPLATTMVEVYSREYCQVGDIVKIKSNNKKSPNEPHSFYFPTKAKVIAIYPTFIRFNNGNYDFCLNKSDLFTGEFSIRRNRK